MNDFYKAMINTAEQCGLKVLSDDFCCKLLAWLYVYGGGNEKVTFDKKMTADIQTAQKRLNLYGAEITSKELHPILRKYINECKETTKRKTYEERLEAIPEWVEKELESRYGKL